MSSNARAFLLGLGTAGVLGGLLLMAFANGAGFTLVILGGIIIASVAFERRYGRPGAASSRASIDWEPTGERFVDEETGDKLEVWMDPLTGERRYEPLGSDPRLPPRRS